MVTSDLSSRPHRSIPGEEAFVRASSSSRGVRIPAAATPPRRRRRRGAPSRIRLGPPSLGRKVRLLMLLSEIALSLTRSARPARYLVNPRMCSFDALFTSSSCSVSPLPLLSCTSNVLARDAHIQPKSLGVQGYRCLLSGYAGGAESKRREADR
jgi:hypothetical protein